MTEKTGRSDRGAEDRTIIVGVVRGAHGLDGRVKVESLSGESGHFSRLKRIVLASGNREIEAEVLGVSGTGKVVILKLDCSNDRDAAEQLRGYEIRVPREQAAPAQEGEYYLADLCQCSVVFDGRVVGRVRSVIDAGARDLLEIATTDDRLVLVPFQDEFVGEVDVIAKTVELKVEWVLE